MFGQLRHLGIVVALSSSIVISSSVWASPVAPDELIRSTANYVLNTIKADKDYVKSPAKASKLIEEKVLPNFDFTRMTRLALGSNWNKATDAQRKELATQFKTLLVRTYSNSLSKYKDHKIEVENAKISGEEAVVKSMIIQPNGKSIPVDYHLEKADNSWKVYDIVIENLSLVTNYRNQFNSLVRNNGIDGLIQSLKDKNAK